MYETFGRFLGRCPFNPDATSPANKNEAVIPQPAGTKLVAREEGYDAENINRAAAPALLQLDAARAAGQTVDITGRVGKLVGQRLTFSVAPGPDVSTVQLTGWVVVGNAAGPVTPENLSAIIDQLGRQLFSAAGAPIMATGFDDGAGNPVDDGVAHPFPVQHVTRNVTAFTQDGITVDFDWENYPALRGMLCRLQNAAAYGGNYHVTEVHKQTLYLLNVRHRFWVTASDDFAAGNLVSWGAVHGVVLDAYLTGAPGAKSGWIEVSIDTTVAGVHEHDTFDGIEGIADGLVNDSGAPGDAATVSAYTKPGDPMLLGDITGANVTLYPPVGVYFSPRALLTTNITAPPAVPDTYRFLYLAPEPQVWTNTAPCDDAEPIATALRQWLSTTLAAYDLSDVLVNIGAGTTPPTKVRVKSYAGEVGVAQLSVLRHTGLTSWSVDEFGDMLLQSSAPVSPEIRLKDSGGEFWAQRVTAGVNSGTHFEDNAGQHFFKDRDLPNATAVGMLAALGQDGQLDPVVDDHHMPVIIWGCAPSIVGGLLHVSAGAVVIRGQIFTYSAADFDFATLTPDYYFVYPDISTGEFALSVANTPPVFDWIRPMLVRARKTAAGPSVHVIDQDYTPYYLMGSSVLRSEHRHDILVGTYGAGAERVAGAHYKSVGEALVAIGELEAIRSAYGADSAFDRSYRILVVGETQETPPVGGYPIADYVDDVVVECVRPHGHITWSTDRTLFDVDGTTMVVARHLRASYTGAAAVDATVFGGTVGSSGLAILQADVSGPVAHVVDVAGLTDFQFDRVSAITKKTAIQIDTGGGGRITNCYLTGEHALLTYGISIGSVGGTRPVQMLGNQIDNYPVAVYVAANAFRPVVGYNRLTPDVTGILTFADKSMCFGNSIEGGSSTGIDVDADHCSILDNEIMDVAEAITIEAGRHGSTISANRISGPTNYGIWICNGAAGDGKHVIDANQIDCTDPACVAGIRVGQLDCMLSSNRIWATNASVAGIHIVNGKGHHTTIVGGVISDAEADGILVEAEDVSISGAYAGVAGAPGTRGVKVTANAARCSIAGGSFSGATYDIELPNTAAKYHRVIGASARVTGAHANDTIAHCTSSGYLRRINRSVPIGSGLLCPEIAGTLSLTWRGWSGGDPLPQAMYASTAAGGDVDYVYFDLDCAWDVRNGGEPTLLPAEMELTGYLSVNPDDITVDFALLQKDGTPRIVPLNIPAEWASGGAGAISTTLTALALGPVLELLWTKTGGADTPVNGNVIEHLPGDPHWAGAITDVEHISGADYRIEVDTGGWTATDWDSFLQATGMQGAAPLDYTGTFSPSACTYPVVVADTDRLMLRVKMPSAAGGTNSFTLYSAIMGWDAAE